MNDTAATGTMIEVNGTIHRVEAGPGTPLLYVLRNDLGLNGPKYGCGLGECGACMVLIEGRAVQSCTIALRNLRGRAVTTLEGLGSIDTPHPVQAAFVAGQAAQCGYCLNGMIIRIVALLGEIPNPDDRTIAVALRHNLCRCGTHVEILNAARQAAHMLGAQMLAGATPA